MSRVRTFVEPFALSYPFATEMVELKPAMPDVHGGVSIAKANEAEGFLFLMLAYLNQAKNDKLTLFVNEETGPSTTIAEGKENDDTPLRLPAGLLQKGLNRIKFQVKRTSGNDEFTKELVLYHRTSPPGDTPPVLNLITSHKVIGAGEADKFKVTVTYDNLQWYDRIFVFCNGAHFEYPLTPSSVAPLPPLPKSVVIDIPKDKLIEGGNDKTFEIKYRVIDYVTNPSGPPTWSDAVFVEVDLDKISLGPPKLINATSPIDVLASEAGVRVQAEFTAAVTNDQATLKVVGGVPGAPFPTVPFNVNQRANFTLSVAFLLAHQGKTIQVSWLLIRDGVQTGESPPLELVIGTIAADDPRLPTPNIAGVTGETLDTNGLPPDARILATKIPLKKPSTPTWVSLAGENADGQTVSLEVWPGNPNESAEGISVPAPVAWLKQLKDGTELRVECAVNLDGIKNRETVVALPARIYTVQAVEDIKPVITSVLGSPSNKPILPNGQTTETTLILSGTAAKGQKIQVLDKELQAGTAIADLTTGVWELTVRDLSAEPHTFIAIAVYGSSQSSDPWLVVVYEFSIDTLEMILNGRAVRTGWPTTGQDFTGNTEIRNAKGGIGTVTYESSNANVASVASDGKVTGQRNGSAVISVKDENSSSVSYPVRVSNIYQLQHSFQPGYTYQEAINWLNSVPGSIPVSSALGEMIRVYGPDFSWPYVNGTVHWMCDASGCSGDLRPIFAYRNGGVICESNLNNRFISWCLRPL